MKPTLPNLKPLLFGGASAVEDIEVFKQITSLLSPDSVTSWLTDASLHDRFLTQYVQWIKDSKLNNLQGLDEFKTSCYSQGTTESFDKFYLANAKRRFRCFRGEYMYHMASWRNYFPNWKFLEDDEILPNDAVVISMPFSDTGNIHPQSNFVLDACDKLGVPVLIDSAFFGICKDINFNYARECITDITFSLSKTLPVSHVRIGMRLTKYDNDDSLLVYNKTAYVNKIGAGLGINLLENWSADYNCTTWGSVQQDFCKQLDVKPSSSVIFGIDCDGRWSEYNRGGNTNRLCFSKYLFSKQLPNSNS